jgi:hypothetical protein
LLVSFSADGVSTMPDEDRRKRRDERELRKGKREWDRKCE